MSDGGSGGQSGGREMAIVRAGFIEEALTRDPAGAIETVKQAYIAHHRAATVNPDSCFLRLPEPAGARAIALPAAIRCDPQAMGLKWISGFPTNLEVGQARASAVIILNDPATGNPKACLEGSIISMARTAASATLAAELTHPRPRTVECLGIVGAGVLANTICTFLRRTGWALESVAVFDRDRKRAEQFARNLAGRGMATAVVSEAREALIRSDLIVFATTATVPHIEDADAFAHKPTVLHISLRDLAPAIVLGAWNAVDDVDHALKAETSLHLAERSAGHRRFVDATIAQLALGEVSAPTSGQLRIVSPFGMGILDIALASRLHDQAVVAGAALMVPDFLPARPTAFD